MMTSLFSVNPILEIRKAILNEGDINQLDKHQRICQREDIATGVVSVMLS